MENSRGFGGIGRALGCRDYRVYWIGMAISTIGSWAYRTALMWLVWELTRSPAWLGYIVFAEVVPSFFIAPPAGAMVDRIGSLRTSKAVQFTWGVHVSVLAYSTFSGFITIELLLALAVLQGTINSFNNPSQLSVLAILVPREDLPPAVALQSATVQGARFIGPPIAGVMLAASTTPTIGAAWTFALNGITFFLFCASLFLISAKDVARDRRGGLSIFGEMVEGFRYIRGHFAIRSVLIFTVVMAAFLRSVMELMPAYADDVFERGAVGFTILTAGSGIGAFIAALWLARRGSTQGITRHFAAHIFVGAVTLIIFALTGHFWLGVALVAVYGFSTNTVSISSQMLIQNAVDGHMRARVMSILGLTFRGIPSLGALCLGLLTEQFGLTWPVVGGAVITLVLVIFLWDLIKRRGLAEAAEKMGGDALPQTAPLPAAKDAAAAE